MVRCIALATPAVGGPLAPSGANARPATGFRRLGPLSLLLVLTALSWTVAPVARGQRPARVGILAWDRCPTAESPYLRALRELGYVEGHTLLVECESAQGRYDALAGAAAALVRRQVEVIAALNHPAAQAAREATRQIPIVLVASGDPVGAGLVASLARPGGNVTGLTYYATELTAKRLELLRDTVPGLRRVGVLHNPALAYLPFLADAQAAARALGLELQVLDVRERGDLPGAVAAAVRGGAQALFVLPDLLLSAEAAQIAQAARAHGLPAMAWGRWFAQAGCLLTYSGDYRRMFERAATYTHRILKGARPADLPVEQPTKFELVINLRTARALGLTIPPAVLARADEVIE
jgi:putative ABC transport system substrate-binding protein